MVMLCVGRMIAYFLAEVLPSNKDVEALRETSNWLIIYVYFPVACHSVSVVCAILFLRYDSIKYLINSG